MIKTERDRNFGIESYTTTIRGFLDYFTVRYSRENNAIKLDVIDDNGFNIMENIDEFSRYVESRLRCSGYSLDVNFVESATEMLMRNRKFIESFIREKTSNIATDILVTNIN